MSTFPEIDRRNPPVPYEVFRDEALREFGRVFAITVLMALIFAGAVWPWKHELAALPFFLMFVGGMWVMTGRRQ